MKYNVPVAQSAEARGLNSLKCQFDPDQGYQIKEMNKMKIKIVEDELYPYHLIRNENHHHGILYEISKKTIENYQIREKQFMQARRNLLKAMEKVSNV